MWQWPYGWGSLMSAAVGIFVSRHSCCYLTIGWLPIVPSSLSLSISICAFFVLLFDICFKVKMSITLRHTLTPYASAEPHSLNPSRDLWVPRGPLITRKAWEHPNFHYFIGAPP